ncbi:MAG: hypothetical protein KC478_07520 [Bacteriovoracaceae bacterium]|nr:hypothetical protein [Bacteriovoracaceae bacterium]
MKLIFSVMLLGALFTSCAHKGHHHEGRSKASCCKEKKDCKGDSCKLKKDEKKSCCSKSKK